MQPNQNQNVNPPGNPPLNQTQAVNIVTISAEPRPQDASIVVVTRGGKTTGEDSSMIRLAGKKKVSFDIDAERETFLQARRALENDQGKAVVYDMPSTFDATSEVGPLQRSSTLRAFLEHFLSLEKYPDALAAIEALLR